MSDGPFSEILREIKREPNKGMDPCPRSSSSGLVFSIISVNE